MGAIEMWGIEDDGRWTMGAMVRYRSRRDMMDMVVNPEFEAAHPFKIATMEKSRDSS